MGKTKEQADEVDSDLVMSEVCATFGQFVKFYVGQSDNDSTAATSSVESKSASSIFLKLEHTLKRLREGFRILWTLCCLDDRLKAE